MSTVTKIASLKDYRDLCHHTLARVILFNAKRGGEAGRMTLSDYENPISAQTADFDLSEFEEKLCERYAFALILSTFQFNMFQSFPMK